MGWQERKQRLQQAFAGMLDIPRDVMLDLPKITLIGGLQIHIENHRGIIEYTDERMRIAVTSGELEIIGAQLVLKNILPEDMVVEGKIRSISLKE